MGPGPTAPGVTFFENSPEGHRCRHYAHDAPPSQLDVRARRASRGAIARSPDFNPCAGEATRVAGGQHMADEFRHRWLYQKSPANPLRLLQAVSMVCALAIAAPKIWCFLTRSVLLSQHQKPELFDETRCSLSAGLDRRSNHGQPGT